MIDYCSVEWRLFHRRWYQERREVVHIDEWHKQHVDYTMWLMQWTEWWQVVDERPSTCQLRKFVCRPLHCMSQSQVPAQWACTIHNDHSAPFSERAKNCVSNTTKTSLGHAGTGSWLVPDLRPCTEEPWPCRDRSATTCKIHACLVKPVQRCGIAQCRQATRLPWPEFVLREKQYLQNKLRLIRIA